LGINLKLPSPLTGEGEGGGGKVLNFRRGWKASAIREAPHCERGASLYSIFI